MTQRTALFGMVLIVALVAACMAPTAQAQSVPLREQLHAKAIASFQQGRFPDAYGRFVMQLRTYTRVATKRPVRRAERQASPIETPRPLGWTDVPGHDPKLWQ